MLGEKAVVRIGTDIRNRLNYMVADPIQASTLSPAVRQAEITSVRSAAIGPLCGGVSVAASHRAYDRWDDAASIDGPKTILAMNMDVRRILSRVPPTPTSVFPSCLKSLE